MGLKFITFVVYMVYDIIYALDGILFKAIIIQSKLEIRLFPTVFVRARPRRKILKLIPTFHRYDQDKMV